MLFKFSCHTEMKQKTFIGYYAIAWQTYLMLIQLSHSQDELSMMIYSANRDAESVHTHTTIPTAMVAWYLSY